MRKNFLLLMLLTLLPLAGWAVDAPTVGVMVGQSVTINGKSGIVTYKVNGAFVPDGSYYPVTITGLDADGLDDLADLQPGGKIALEIPVSFNEKYGDSRYNYAVTFIEDGLDAGENRQAFYGYTAISSLRFVNPNVGTTGAPAVALDKFSYKVGTTGGAGKSFYGCTSMATLEFTENCTSIAQYSFQNTAITSFTIPKKCETIEAYAFWNCQNLNKVEVASDNTVLTTLADYVFANSALRTLDLTEAKNLYTIGTGGKSPFWYTGSPVNNYLKTVKLPNNVKDINDSFAKCTALTDIQNLENTKLGVAAGTPAGSPAGTHIMNGAFTGCRSLPILNFPNCDIIGVPFAGCVALKEITFVDGYDKTIYPAANAVAGSNLFGVNAPGVGYVAADQAALETVTFNGVMKGKIDANAFVGMTGLAKVDFKGQLQSGATINAAFTDVTSLKDVVFNGINSNGNTDVTIAANAFKNTGISALDFKGINLESNNNKDFVIAANAFSDCADLLGIQFGSINVENTGIINIAGAAFNNNPKLAKVTFGTINFTDGGQLNIANDAFATGNILLSEVEFGAITTSDNKTNQVNIGAGATVFGDGAHLSKVKFGNVTARTFSIGANAFKSTGLKEVTFGNIAADKDGASTFTIGVSAFEGGDAADKVVTIGTIKDNGNGQLTATISQDAFAAKMLKEVEIKDMEATSVTIDANAFANANQTDYATNNETLLATQNLQTVKLGNITASANAASTFSVADGAFWGGKTADKTVEIGTIKDAATVGTMTATIATNAFAAEKLKSVKIGEMAAAAITINSNAFANKKTTGVVPATQNLQSVTLGNITASNISDATLTIAASAFWGGNVDDKVVTIGTIKDKATATQHTTSVTINQDAFVGQSLKSVTIGDMAATAITIHENAFSNATKDELDPLIPATVPATQNLQTVKLGEIKAGNGVSTFEAKQGAFWGGNVAAKSVEIGNITNASVAATMTATIGDQVAEADQLTNVKIGNMTATSLTIGKNAFAGKQLQKVELGDMTAATLTVDDYAFANVNPTDVLTENVTIGELRTANFTGTTYQKAFQGPQAAGSALNVTIAKISAAPNIPANTFVAPAKGTASYTVLGDVAAGATANIAAGSFTGSRENVLTPVKNTTSVKFQGDYNAEFNQGVFTNVNDVEIAVASNGGAKSYNVAGDLKAFEGAKIVTVGDIPTGKSIVANEAGYTEAIEQITFLKNVADANAIGTFNSTKIRKIEFANVKNSGVTVAKDAVQNGAFTAAADAAMADGENITVIYREEQTREAVNIFNAQAFGAINDQPVVTLYTTKWAKANIYESTDPVLNWTVNRLAFSGSDVAPGEPIIAKVAKPAGWEYAYGKLYIPKGVGMKYRIKSDYDDSNDKNQVQVYYGQIDNSNGKIYMYQLPIINDYFWIDATDVDQAFLIRTSKAVNEIEATAVVEGDEEEAKAKAENDLFYYFGAALAVQNHLRYNTEQIANQNLHSDAEFMDRAVYMMDNPATYGYQFRKIDKNSTVTKDGITIPRYMPANSLYIVGKLGSDASAAPLLEVVFVDDENAADNVTGIETVKNNNDELNSDAVYNLQGVRVSGAQKGIYIQNGKKFVVK